MPGIALTPYVRNVPIVDPKAKAPIFYIVKKGIILEVLLTLRENGSQHLAQIWHRTSLLGPSLPRMGERWGD